MERRLHIVSFDVPYPADYGGVIDVYYKIKALADQGVSIILHCYQYGRPEQKELEGLCEKVYYYPRLLKAFSPIFWRMMRLFFLRGCTRVIFYPTQLLAIGFVLSEPAT